ncbi:histidine kinase [Pedobacter metabolipauper]|uniref:Histidine kinase n=1 Tax=Pedobacter metabolipauper TaxID=425513 RepID=A0A4R6SY98_9SPHI|nr:histidine kinase [Pedobacter metabolipauper]TDQ10992.1 histidine kinase [Pedobacter metabolipauper]
MHHTLIVFLLLLFLPTGYVQVIEDEEPVPVYHTGDNIAWAAKGFNDKNWNTSRSETDEGIFWSRTHLLLRPVDNNRRPLGLQIGSFGTFDVYWDGVLIGSNGVLPYGHRPEQPGTECSIFIVPDSLTSPGAHIVAMRMSQAYLPDVHRSIGFKMEKYTSLLTLPLITMSYMNLMAGAFLIASLYYFFLYFNSKHRQVDIMIFATICLLFFCLLIMEYLKFHMVIPYPQFYIRLEIIGWLTFTIALLIPWYFTIQFHFKWKLWLLGLLLGVLLGLYYFNYGNYDLTAKLYSLVMLIASFMVVINGIIQKEKGGYIVFIGLLASAMVNEYLFYDYSLFISFTLIVLCMLYLHAIRASSIESEHQEALVLSSRLQLELLKKNIQPHFLRNTLTSMMDWVEESPKEGARFIQALSAEFDIMNSISEQTLIPIRQEIELCRQHLSVMEFRKEIRFEWKEYGIDDAQLIPPAVLHTLLENGITHSIPLQGNRIVFKLTYTTGPGYRQYVFDTFAENRPVLTGREGGNGFKYIRARLTESYGQNWTLHSAATAAGWSSTIKILDR